MKTFTTTAAALVATALPLLASAYVVVDPNHLPHKSEKGQVGYNDCGTKDSKTAMCQTSWINSIKDFCFFAPSHPNGVIGDDEENLITWCLAAGHGARLIPKGTLKGIQYLQTKHYIQITAVGDFTKVNVKGKDEGGEEDPHGPTGAGNPIGGIMLGKVGGKNVQFKEWHEFIAYNELSIRVCFPQYSDAATWCPHTYDVMGAYWNDPAPYKSGSFEVCKGQDGTPPGIYVTNGKSSTFHQGQPHTPAAHKPVASSSCVKYPAPSGASYPKRRALGPAGAHEVRRDAMPTPIAAGEL